MHTLTLTDIASGWTDCVALLVRDSALVVEALSRLRTSMPFPLLGVDTDNGSEFINAAIIAYCKEMDVEFTRSRPYRKNDQTWVEQKNGSVVWRLVGYRRLEGLAALDALSRLYATSWLFVNFFQPSQGPPSLGSEEASGLDVQEPPRSRARGRQHDRWRTQALWTRARAPATPERSAVLSASRRLRLAQ